jgi:hypothetical protein
VYFSEGLASVKEREDRPDFSKGPASVKLDQMVPRALSIWMEIWSLNLNSSAPRVFREDSASSRPKKQLGYINKKGENVWEGPYVEYGIVL